MRSCRDTREIVIYVTANGVTRLRFLCCGRIITNAYGTIRAVVGARDDGFFTEHNRLRLLSLLGGLPARPSAAVNTQRSLIPES